MTYAAIALAYWATVMSVLMLLTTALELEAKMTARFAAMPKRWRIVYALFTPFLLPLVALAVILFTSEEGSEDA